MHRTIMTIRFRRDGMMGEKSASEVSKTGASGVMAWVKMQAVEKGKELC